MKTPKQAFYDAVKKTLKKKKLKEKMEEEEKIKARKEMYKFLGLEEVEC